MRERDIEEWLRGQVEKRGGLFMKFSSPGQDGVPDRLVIMPGGRMMLVELKTETGRLSKVQVYQIDRLTDMGIEVGVVYGMAGAREWVEDLDKHVVMAGVWCGI